MAHSLKLEVLLAAVDKATAPLKRISKATQEAAQSARNTHKALRELNKTQGNIDAYRRANIAINRSAQALNHLKQQTDKVADAHAKAKAKQSDLKAEMTSAQRQFERIAKAMKNAGGHSATLSNELDKTRLRMDQIRKAQSKASEEVQKHGRRLRTLGEQESRTRHQTDEARKTIEAVGRRLRDAGHDMQHLGRESRALNQNEGRLNDTLRTQRERLDKLRQAQEQATAAREKFESVRNGAAVGGAAGVATGYVVGRGLHGSVDEAKDSENSERSLNLVGVSEEARKRLMQFADAAKLAGSSLSERRRYMVDAYTVLGDEHHAKMALPAITKMATSLKMQNPMMGEEEIDKLMMDTLKSAEWRPGSMVSAEAFEKALDYQQRVASASGGRVNGSSYNQFLSHAGIAAKGLSDEALYLRFEPFIQEMGASTAGTSMMSAYQNLYQGRVTKQAAQKMISLGLMDGKHVTFDKVGQQAFGGPGGLKNANIFRENPIEWVRSTLLPALNAKGITDTKAQIDAVGSLVSNRTAAQMISTMLLQVKDGSQDRRFGINSNAKGLNDSYDVLRVSTSGREVETVARYHDLMRLIGEKVLPTYNAALEKINAHMVALSDWMTKHPKQAEMIVKAIMAFGAAAAVLGGLSLAFSALSGPIMMVARTVMFLGSVMMANPIFALIAAIAIAAVLIYTYWEPIKKWFASIGIDLTWLEDLVKRSWNRIRQAFDQGLGGILLLMMEWSPIGLAMKACGALLDYLGIQIPDELVEVGHKLQQSLIDLFSWQSIARRIDEAKAAFRQGLGGILLMMAKWSPMGLIMRACGALLDYLGIQMPDWLVSAGRKLQQAFIDIFSWQVIGDRLKRFLNAIKEAFNGNLRELGALIWDWSPVGMLINKLNEMRREIESLMGADKVGGAVMGTLSLVGDDKLRNAAIHEGQQVATTGSQIASKSVATASQVINIAVNGVGNKEDAQAVGLEVKRQLKNAMDQLKARGRSGMADRG